MRFNNLSNGAQSEIDLNSIDRPCAEYIQLMIISLVYYPYSLDEKNILIIGLGGGILPRSIRKLNQTCSITIVEIDSIVYQMAKKYFHFVEDSKMKVFIEDGRTFLQSNANLNQYDIILFDAYDSDSILPFHMKTQEFFQQIKENLNPNGSLVVLNLVCIYQSYFNIRSTLQSVFGKNNLIQLRSNDFLNIVALTSFNIHNFGRITRTTRLIDSIQQNLSIDVQSLLNSKEKRIDQHDSSIQIYKDQNIVNEQENNISLFQFIDI